MQAYRVYRIDGAGKFWAADWIEAEGDDNAFELAQALNHRCRCELWQGNRFIAQLEPKPPAAA